MPLFRPRLLPLLLLLLAGCKAMQPKTLEPDAFYDSRLSAYLDLFLQDAADHHLSVNSDRLSQLRVLKFVDSITAEKSHYGASAQTGDESTVGTCAEIDQNNNLNLRVHSWKTSETKWSEIWLASSFADASVAEKNLRELIYHELGHCLLGRAHAPLTPHQIMSPETAGNADWLAQHWNELLAALFAET